MKDEAKLRRELAGYTGTENYYSHPFVRTFTYTDGAALYLPGLKSGVSREFR